MRAVCAVDCRDTLGEGCISDPRDGALYWTDIEGRRLHRLGPDGAVTTWPVPERVAFILPRRAPGFIVGFADRVALADPGFTRFETLHVIEASLPQTRVNDAAVDPEGGVVFGTFDERDRKPVASLYRIAPDGALRRLLGDITISNGLAFSPDGSVMYFADTPVGTIRRFAVGPGFGAFDEIQPLAGPDIAPGKPDGAVVDSRGHYWSARVWGGCVVRIAPDGSSVERVDLPTKGPTCVAFDAARPGRLYVTTLRVQHTAEELEQSPQAGGLYAVDVGVEGLPQRQCRL